ncbi:hypothetical protein BDN70DRAFT_880903 [Pholiota conissans]|uniref:Uncharacterized protein n=1 Tax=Pholiota conissans TaxID=109636 RepID=A0A9P5YYQ6_9AGAR|nr:hypothetical protein BDN70DRAFT_880903 [Pholiota conissans]
MYGGVLYGAKDDSPTSDFSICDVSNMRWTNLTYRLNWIHNPHDRFSTRSEEPLPCISSPGATLLRMRNSSYIAIVGGFDGQTQQARSGIVLVDPTAREWWNLDIQGIAPGPRISPAVVAVGSRIYVFGGYRRFGDDPQPYYSYSIAEHLADKGVWSWSTCDEPYSSAVPVGMVFQEACAVYNGAKILLTPGRLTDSEHINFTPENNIFFHTEHKKFQPATADITGTFPSNVRWYSVSRPSVAISAFDSTVIICCFVDVPGTDDVAPEVWRLSLTPHEKIDSLNIMRKIWDLNSDFQGAICVGGKVRLMGWDQVGKDARWNTFLDILWNQ